jgi:hypothetical protein
MPVPGHDLRNQPLNIDFLYWEDCPSHERALSMLDEVLKEQKVQARVRVMRVDTPEQAEELRFPGSPTIRVDGIDIDDPSLPVGLSCRIYRHQNGKISPLPERERIAWAVRRATRDPQIADSGVLAACDAESRG